MTSFVDLGGMTRAVVGGERPRRQAPMRASESPLKAGDKSANIADRHGQSDAVAKDTKTLRILLIEDQPTVARSLTRLLEPQGMQVDWSADGETGLDMARTGSYDAILLDRVLPRLSGDRVLEQLKKEANPTPVIILTGYPDHDSAFRAARLGAACYLEKGGLSSTELCSAVRQAVAVRRERRSQMGSEVSLTDTGTRSQAVADLLAYLATSQNFDRARVARVLARVLIAVNLKEGEFLAVGRSLRLVQRQPQLPISLIRATIQAWVENASTARGQRTRAAVMDEHDYTIMMRHAVLELATSDEYVSQIAYGLGCSDHANFDRSFREFFGLTPTQFRQLVI